MSDPELDEPVPKLPRGRGLKLSGPEVFRIVITAVMLVAVIVLARPCGDATSKFISHFGSGSNAGSARPGTVGKPAEPIQYEQLRPGMTDDEIKAAIQRAKRRAGSNAP